MAGHVAPRLVPNALARLSRAAGRRRRRSGTNGKTTTTRLLAQILAHQRAADRSQSGGGEPADGPPQRPGPGRRPPRPTPRRPGPLRGRRGDVPQRSCPCARGSRADQYLSRPAGSLWRSALRRGDLAARAGLALRPSRSRAECGRSTGGEPRQYPSWSGAVLRGGRRRARQPFGATRRRCPALSVCGAPLAHSIAFYGHLGHYRLRRPAGSPAAPQVRIVGPTRLEDNGYRSATDGRRHLVRASRCPCRALQRVQCPGRLRPRRWRWHRARDRADRAGDLPGGLWAPGARTTGRPGHLPGAGQESGRLHRGAPTLVVDPTPQTLFLAINDCLPTGRTSPGSGTSTSSYWPAGWPRRSAAAPAPPTWRCA